MSHIQSKILIGIGPIHTDSTGAVMSTLTSYPECTIYTKKIRTAKDITTVLCIDLSNLPLKKMVALSTIHHSALGTTDAWPIVALRLKTALRRLIGTTCHNARQGKDVFILEFEVETEFIDQAKRNIQARIDDYTVSVKVFA